MRRYACPNPRPDPAGDLARGRRLLRRRRLTGLTATATAAAAAVAAGVVPLLVSVHDGPAGGVQAGASTASVIRRGSGGPAAAHPGTPIAG